MHKKDVMTLRELIQGRTCLRLFAAISAMAILLTFAGLAAPQEASAAAVNQTSQNTTITSTGLKPNSIKHVWLIILENKSYDETFTGLNKNSYLWQNLPAQGALLKNYYCTGHYSMDNYTSMVSGQAPEQDVQSDCDVKNTQIGTNRNIISNASDVNYGQVNSPANASQASGANAADGSNGCTYTTDVPTLFNQLNAAGKTWKGYSQDLHGAQTVGETSWQDRTVANREDGACGAPGTSTNNPVSNPTYLTPTSSHPAPSGVTSFTGAQSNDQYVAKHFPFPWFESLTGGYNSDGTSTAALNEPTTGTNCDSDHISNLDDPNVGLVHDLQQESTTPSFSWITPNNCSDAHDAVCKGNNLSGAFNKDGSPDYHEGSSIAYNPEATTPTNYTGDLYASDLFLEYYIPLIERSQAFKDGGLIDITFDEANPPFTYGGSFNNADQFAVTSENKANAANGIKTDAAGENIDGKNVNTEPTGPNSTLGTDSSGNQLYPGPGNNAFIDRPPTCTSTNPKVPANCVPGIVRGGSGNSPTASTQSVTGDGTSSTITDGSISAKDTGRAVTGTNIPADSFVGAVTNSGPVLLSSSSGHPYTGEFQLVDKAGNPVKPTGAVSSVTLSAEGDPNHLESGQTADPLYDATDATPGGGDTGSVLISPLIKPGTVSTTNYDHYSWLRTMEDLFDVSSGNGNSALPAGTVSGGLDGQGHLGFAAEKGLKPFGLDVFTAAGSNAIASTTTKITGKWPANPTVNGTTKLTASVASGANSVTSGTVNFEDGGNVLATSSIDQSGSASATVSNLSVGSHQITAVFVPADAKQYSGSTSSAVTVNVSNAINFTDLNQVAHADDVAWAGNEGIATGFKQADGTYRFEGMPNVQRQDMAAFLYRLAGSPAFTATSAQQRAFTDVNANTPHANEIWWLAAQGIATGYKQADGTYRFEGSSDVQRQDMAAFLYRLAGSPNYTASLKQQRAFTDVNAGTPFSKEVWWLASQGIATGFSQADGSSKYGVGQFTVRQDMAAFLHREWNAGLVSGTYAQQV